MQQVKILAPTFMEAITAIEQGCRRIQSDPHFLVNVGVWLEISDDICYGCIATTTLMQLTNKTGKDLVDCLGAESATGNYFSDRTITKAFGIQCESDKESNELSSFEIAISSFRLKDLQPLLHFYDLLKHENAKVAGKWLYENQPISLISGVAKPDLLLYADFLKDEFIPRIQKWFSGTA